ncbi:MAG: MFS transporter [Gammaproteobacteria bacterium]|nr:MFS transporter [Gammaproteobacteria bacterium]
MNNIDRTSAILAACVISALGAMIYNILPLFLGVAQDVRNYSDQQLGFITAIYFLGFFLVTISAFFWVRKIDWKLASFIAAILTVFALLGSSIAEGFIGFLLCMFIIGSTSSALYGIATTMLGDTTKAARSFGFKIGAEAALGALLMFTLPSLVVERWGFIGILFTGAVVALLLSIAIVWLPRKGVKGEDETEKMPDLGQIDFRRQLPVILGLLGIFVFFGGISSLWAFLERMGNDGGYAAVDVGTALSVSLIGAMAGSFIAAFVGEHMSRRTPLLFAMATFFGAVILLTYVDGVGFFTVGCALFAMSFGFSLPFQVTIVSDFDSSGRFVVLTAPALALGGIAGPAIAGMLKTGLDYMPIVIYASCAVLVSVVLFLMALKLAQVKPGDDSSKVSSFI